MFKSENLNKRSTGIQGLLQIANGDPSVLDTLLESFESSSDQKELLLAFNDKSHAMWDFSGSVAKTNHSQMIKRKLDLSDLLWIGFSWLVLASIAFYFVSIAGISNAISFLVGVFVQAFMYVVVVLIPDSLSPIKVIIFLLPWGYGIIAAVPDFSILGVFPPFSFYALGEAVIGLVR